MDTNSTKKRTAVVATATAAALLLTGTFAWTLATDDTVLNPFGDEDKGSYGAEIVEQFNPEDPWTEKVVTVKNTADNPVIVRVRFEEFYDLTSRVGSEYDVPEGYLKNTEGASAIFTAADLTDSKDPSSTKLAEAITLNFGTGVVTMDEYTAMADKSAVEWVIDSDGWCYYTKALLAGETTKNLLEKVSFDETNFGYNQPYDLNYKINVRLQAISADLEDYGAKDNPAQWTNEDYVNDEGITVGGRIIAATDNKYEITSDSDITPQAESLVVGITNTYTNPYANDDGSIAVAVSTWPELYDAFMDPTVHSILVTDDIEVEQYTKNSIGSERLEAYGFEDGQYTYTGDKMIDLGHHTITKDGASWALFNVYSGATVVLKHGTVNVTGTSVADVSSNKSAGYAPGYLELVDITATGNASGGYAIRATLNCGVKMYNSTITNIGTNVGTTALKVANDTTVELYGSKLISEAGSGIKHLKINNNMNMNLTMENSSVIGKGDYGILLDLNDTLKATNCEISGKYAIFENHDRCPASIELTDTKITTTSVGIYKVGNHPMTMKNCDMTVNPEANSTGMGIFIRSGDNTLDNVNVLVNTNTDMVLSTNEQLDNYYSTTTGHCDENNEALQIVLNSYESVNVDIIGGSYTTNVDGAKSVYVFDAAGTYSTGGQIYETYDWNNSITVTGNPTFSPAFTFENSYTNTTVTQ